MNESKNLKFDFPMVSLKFSILFLKSLTNSNNLNSTKFKAFADNKLNVAKMMISLFDRVENIVGKGENAGYHIVFQSLLLWGH